MKPLGMTAMFQLVVPDRVQNEIFEAVESAIAAGMSPKDFIREVRECWEIVLTEAKRRADAEFKQQLDNSEPKPL